jgi:uncharacterized repeat protein (TIGR02543 family)
MKRRILNVLVCLCMLLVVSLLSTACGSKTYKMTFETNGGTLTETVKEYTKDKEVGDLPTPTYAGYDFIGWFEDKDFKVQLSSSSKYNKDLTVYAKYELSTLTLTLDPNGGEGEQQKITGKMGDKITLPTCTFTKTGNEFSSWSVSKNADEDAKSYSDEDEFIFGSESLTLYADWAKEHYNIAYVPYDGTPSAGSLPTGYGTVYYGDKLPTLVKTYYDYVGWTETDLEESHGDFTTMTTCPDFGSTGVFVTLYCDFVYHPYKLTVSGSSAVPNLYVHYESNKIYKDEEFKTIFSESDIVNEISIGYHFYGLRFATSQFSGDVEAAGRLLTNYYVLRPSVSVQTKNGDVNLTITLTSVDICRRLGEGDFDEAYKDGVYSLYSTVIIWFAYFILSLIFSYPIINGMSSDIKDYALLSMVLYVIMHFFRFLSWNLISYILCWGGELKILVWQEVFVTIYFIVFYFIGKYLPQNIYLSYTIITIPVIFQTILGYCIFRKKKWMKKLSNDGSFLQQQPGR